MMFYMTLRSRAYKKRKWLLGKIDSAFYKI